MDEKTQQLIFQMIDQTITPDDFDSLQEVLLRDESVRAEYLKAVSLASTLSELSIEQSSGTLNTSKADLASGADGIASDGGKPRGLMPGWNQRALALAAALLLSVCGSSYWLGKWNESRQAAMKANPGDSFNSSSESLVAGHASLRRAVDLRWGDGAAEYREGDILPAGLLEFETGIAEIDFFCGATLIVEGPARLDVQSDWTVRVAQGRLRASVPPAARGFVVKAADSEIIDLGTEFALDVAEDGVRVEVIDGEVELRGGKHGGQHLTTGQRRTLSGTVADSIEGLSTVADFLLRRDGAEQERLTQWRRYSRKLRSDERLIAYYSAIESSEGREIVNQAQSGSDRDGHIIGAVERTDGRFGVESSGLAFGRVGSRVRTRIDGEFQAFTFSCWVRIGSLENRYNALFMGDGYENGEPHWQIHSDGRIMLSVMVDDSQEVSHFSELEQTVVTGAGLHRVYYSEPFWDISKSGQWFHLVAVYDPAARWVTQYVNGKQLAREKIADKFHITRLRIGPAEIGNWGQPFRATPQFAVRNLNGTIDELEIFDSALEPAEIQDLYEQGKPLGY